MGGAPDESQMPGVEEDLPIKPLPEARVSCGQDIFLEMCAGAQAQGLQPQD
jgi:hypothetical protein